MTGQSQENNIHIFTGRHHATEQFGIPELMGKTLEHVNIEYFFDSKIQHEKANLQINGE
jgi:putative NIF3 family GTP cyclohydrolase 1 type 2